MGPLAYMSRIAQCLITIKLILLRYSMHLKPPSTLHVNLYCLGAFQILRVMFPLHNQLLMKDSHLFQLIMALNFNLSLYQYLKYENILYCIIFQALRIDLLIQITLK